MENRKQANLDVKNTLVYILQRCPKINVSHDAYALYTSSSWELFFTGVETQTRKER